MAQISRIDPLDELFRGFFVRPVEFNGHAQNAPSIRMDVRENETAYLVQADLPGVGKDAINVEIEGNQISISAEVRREQDVSEGEQLLKAERPVGKLSRTFQLAHEIDDTQAGARYIDGVLTLHLPKRIASNNKRLVIQ